MEYIGRMSPRESKAKTAVNQAAMTLVREAFAGSGMTRVELSERTGIPDGTLAGLFAGTKPLYAEQLVVLASTLNVDIEKWFADLVIAAKRGQIEADDQ